MPINNLLVWLQQLISIQYSSYFNLFMAEKFYQHQILTLIRSNQLLNHQLKLFKNHTAKLINAFLTFLNANFKLKHGAKSWERFLRLKEAELVTFEMMGRLLEVVEGIEWVEVKGRREEGETRIEQGMEGRVVGKVEQLLAQYIKSSSESFNYQNLIEQNRQNLTIIKQLQTSLNHFHQQQEVKNKKILNLKSISQQLQAQLIESNYIHEVQRRFLKEQISKLKLQAEKMNNELKKMHFSYEKLCQNSLGRSGLFEEESLDRPRKTKR